MKNRFTMFCMSFFFVLCFAKAKATDPPPQPTWDCVPSIPQNQCVHPIGLIYEGMIWGPIVN
jgi:hypothetical protein